MREDEARGWLRLMAAPSLAGEAARAALASFGLPETILDASELALAKAVGERAARELKRPDGAALAAEDLTLGWLASVPGARLVTLADAQYPRRLLEADDPPVALLVRGDVGLLGARDSVALLGGPAAAGEADRVADAFSAGLRAAGVAVCVDLATTVGVAAVGDGRGVIACFGGGPDRVEEPVRREARRVAAAGLIVSRRLCGAPPAMGDAGMMARLARAVLAVAAPLGSPAMAAARLAGDLGREVFAVPGSVESGLWRGCHRLIREGAALVERPQEIVEAFAR